MYLYSIPQLHAIENETSFIFCNLQKIYSALSDHRPLTPPVSSSAVCCHVRIVFVYSHLYQISFLCSWKFPLFPYTHTYSVVEPSVDVVYVILHTCNSVVVKPSPRIHQIGNLLNVLIHNLGCLPIAHIFKINQIQIITITEQLPFFIVISYLYTYNIIQKQRS